MGRGAVLANCLYYYIQTHYHHETYNLQKNRHCTLYADPVDDGHICPSGQQLTNASTAH